MNVIFLGPPGAGKGTLADLSVKDLGLPHISTGDLFRTAIHDETPLGLKVKDILASGALVPDDLTIAMVMERFAKPDTAKGWILDGFPRTIGQAEALQKVAQVDLAVNFDIPDDILVERLSGRRICRGCGKIYNARTKPPLVEGVCDACGGEVYTRPDDSEDSVRIRLHHYREQTAPLIAWYGAHGVLQTLDSVPEPAVVLERFEAILRNHRAR